MAPQPQRKSEDLDTTHLLADYPESSSAPEVLSSPTDDTMDHSKGLPPAYTPSAPTISEPSYPNPLTSGYITPAPMIAVRPLPPKYNPTLLAINCGCHHDTFTHACVTSICCFSTSEVTKACCAVNMCESKSLLKTACCAVNMCGSWSELDQACCAVNMCGSWSGLDQACCGINLCGSTSLLSKAVLGVDLCGSLSKLGRALFAIQCCTGEER
jgi:hypothetical protein